MSEILESRPVDSVPFVLPGQPISPHRIEILFSDAPSVTVGSWDVNWDLSYFIWPEYEEEDGPKWWGWMRYQIRPGSFVIVLSTPRGPWAAEAPQLRVWPREWFLRDGDHPTIPARIAGTIEMDPGAVTDTPIFRAVVKDHNWKILEIKGRSVTVHRVT